MATNPRIPETFEPKATRPETGLKTPRPGGGKLMLLLALVVAALLLAAILYFMPRAPKALPPRTAADVPAQLTGDALQLSALKMTPDPTGNALYIEGNITNTGQQTISGAAMHMIFHAADGRVLADMNSPIQSLSTGQGNSRIAQELSEAPLKPNDTRPFRIGIDHVPQGWNHQMPEVRIGEITSHQ